MRSSKASRVASLLLMVLALWLDTISAAQEKMDSYNLERARGILHDAYQVVKDHYYDVQFHGLDWNARFREYDEKIRDATSLSAAFGVVASFLDGLNDSHTFFRTPQRPFHFDYGYRMQIVGDAAFITQIRPGTDAESKVHLGDRVVGYNNFEVSRQNFHKLIYLFGSLAPLKLTQLKLITASGEQRQALVDASVKEQKSRWDFTSPAASFDIWQIIREEQNIGRLVRPRYHEVDDTMIWKLPEFFLSDSEVDDFFGIARKHKSLILDLRGNPGGAVLTLERMLGNTFEHDVKLADRLGRKKELKPEVAKSRGGSAYSGKIVVLVDGASASASELFARTIQLEHRGIVVGDRTSGSVMEAKGFPFAEGSNTKIFYSFSVTEADLIMKDGNSLEHVGVTPDVIVLPTADDLAAGRDPALARAAELAGINLDPVEAGKLFPFEWLPL